MISRTPLHIACSKGCLEITKELLEFNAKVNVTDNTGKTPLLLAIEAKSPDCVKLLLDYHADLTFRDQRGDAAIHYAVSQDSIEILSILLAAGVSANTHNEYGLTPIHMATKKQSVEMLTFLLENEAEVNCVDQKRRSALMLACINGNQLIAEMLLQAGADPKLKDVEGFTALKYAKMYHNQQCADLVKKSARCESRREFDQTPDLTSDAAYNQVPQYSQEGSDEIESCDKNRETSLSDNVILEKPPLPPGVSSLATTSNSRTNQSNPNNNYTPPNNLFRFPTTAASSAEDETGEEILDLVSTSDEDEASGITSEPSSEVEMKEEGEDDEQEQEMGDNIGDESGETFVFLHEISKGKFEEQAMLSDSSYISDLIHVDMIGPRSVHFAKSTVGSALDLTRKPLELDSTKHVHQPASPIRQDPVRCVSSRPTSVTNAASNKSEHSISTRSDKQLSELGSSVLRGQRPSPDGGTVTTPSPPAPSVSEDSVACTTVQDVSITEPVAHECDLNDLDVSGSNEMELKPSVSNGIRQSQDLLVHPTNCEGDSWQSDTDSHGKEEMRKLEAAIGQKIREHAKLSFLSQSTPHLTTPSASEPIATEPKAIPKQTLWDSGPSAADIIDEGSCWDSSEDEKPKDLIPAENSKISKDTRLVEEIIAAKFQSEKRIWMYDEFQSNEDQTADDWDSDSTSQVRLMAQNGKFTSNGVEKVTVVDGVLPNTKENESLVPGSLIGPLKQAVEWESDPEDRSTDSECQPVLNYPQTGFTVDGGETRFLVQKMDHRLTEFGDGRPKSEELNGRQNNEKTSTGFRSASENDQVVVSVQSAGSDDEDGKSASLSPIAEAEENAPAVEGDMAGFGATRNKSSGSGYVRGSPKQNNMPKEFKPHERTGSEKADHQTVLLSASNRFVDNEMTEADDIPIVDEEGIAVGHSVYSKHSPIHKSRTLQVSLTSTCTIFSITQQIPGLSPCNIVCRITFRDLWRAYFPFREQSGHLGVIQRKTASTLPFRIRIRSHWLRTLNRYPCLLGLKMQKLNADAMVCHESSNSAAAADLLRARLIQALQALSRERACHEELELARDAAKARVRELTLLQAQAVAVGTVEQNLSEVSGGQEVKHYAELNSKLMDYRFLLLEEQEKRKYAEEKLNESQIEMENKEKQIAKLLAEKSTLEQKASESTMKAEGLCVENKKIENAIEDLKLKLELSQEGLKRVANLKVDVLHVQEKLESLKTSWKEDFSTLAVQLEQNKCLQMKQADHFNNTLPKRFEARESSVQFKLSEIMNTEETIYSCLESSLQEPPSSETESMDDHFITAIPDGLDRFRAFLEVLKASKVSLFWIQAPFLNLAKSIPLFYLPELKIVKQPPLWTRFTQTEPEDLSNNEHPALAKPRIYQGNMTEPKVHSLSASMSSSIGSITKIQDRSCSPIEQLSSCDTRHASDKSGHVEVNKVFWCETCLRQNRRVEFDGITPKYLKNATAECPYWLHHAVPSIISHDTKCPQPIISYQTQSHPTTGLSSPRYEAQKTSHPEPEIAALRRRISELEADRDWLARENSRLVDRTEKQTRLTEKLTTRLSQQNQTAAMPSSIYPSTQYALPQPVVVPSSCVLASSPYVTPHLYYQLKDPFMSREDPYVTPQRRPSAADRSIARELLAKTCHASNTGPENADYPEVDQCNVHESTWSLDQDLDGDSVNAQLLESRKCVQRKKLGDRLFNDTFDQLKPELERSINRHLEAAGEQRAISQSIALKVLNKFCISKILFSQVKSVT
ncbi:Ankyrin repeat domain containing protein [Fasciola gigantica]|uniref:Ankyrin repeat domain containing protein n=1 Tax=Fasciola gigantica TaxID=46835 RepID=A0A504YGG7_FASGI|nr:Ankyrin repeat domain containing protein [Fasciola gigantica]